MKIIRTDNYDRESVADELVADNIEREAEGQTMLYALCASPKRGLSDWYKLVPDDYRLWRGMSDLVEAKNVGGTVGGTEQPVPAEKTLTT